MSIYILDIYKMSVVCGIIIMICLYYAYKKYMESIKWAAKIPGYDEPFWKSRALQALFSSRRSKVTTNTTCWIYNKVIFSP